MTRKGKSILESCPYISREEILGMPTENLACQCGLAVYTNFSNKKV